MLRNRHIVPLPKFPAILVRPSQVKSQNAEPPQALLVFCSWKRMPRQLPQLRSPPKTTK